MGYYDKFLMHEDKRDKGMNSTTNEKGTDGKKNNSSAYNHDYYMKNKEKWGVKTEIGTDKDWDDLDKLPESARIGDSDFFGKKNDDGTWTIYEEDMVWRLPKGVELDADMRKALSEFKGMQDPNIKNSKDWEAAVEKIINAKNPNNSNEKEFDVDAAAMDVIRGKYKNGQERKDALGADYEMVQKRVNELMKQQKSSSSISSSSNSNKSSSSSSSSSESSGPHWRGKGGSSSTSSSSAQNDQEKTSSSSSSSSKRPRGRQRNITGSATGTITRSTANKPRASIRQRNITGSASIRHSEVYGTINDWRDYECLYHHGIKGQKWGVRRFQNADGTLTAKGQKRYGEKVTMHQGKTNVFVGGNRYRTHNEFKTANNFAKGTYKQNKARIKEEYKEAREKGEKGALRKSIAKRIDNTEQYNYELARNRVNAGQNELKRGAITGAAKRGAAAAAVVGAGVLAGMLHANYMNNRLKRDGAGMLTAAGIDQHYEYKIGKAQVAKYLGKAVAIGALVGASNEFAKTSAAQERVDNAGMYDRTHTVANSRRKRAEADERRWKEGRV